MKKLGFLLTFCFSLQAIEFNEIQLNASALQVDGKIVAVGNVTIGNTIQILVARYNTNGSLDTTFGTNGIVRTSVGDQDFGNAIAVQSDGKIIITGTTVSSSTEFLLIRYLTNGNLDTTFGSAAIGIVTTLIGSGANANAIGLQSDDKIVVTGSAVINGQSQFAIVRYINDGINDGDLDPTYGTAGIQTSIIGQNALGNALVIQTDDKAIVGGSTTENGLLQFTLARYTTSGTLDGTFDTDGVVVTPFGANARINSLALQSTGEIVAGGFSDNDFALARYTSTGSLDVSFNGGGTVTTSISNNAQVNSVVIQTTGEIVAAGSFTGGMTTGFALARYTSGGSLDATFGTGGLVTNDTISPAQAQEIVLQTDGDLVPVGFSGCGALLIRYLTNGSIDISFGQNGFVFEPANNIGCLSKIIASQSQLNIIDTQIDLVESCCESNDSRINILETCCEQALSCCEIQDTRIDLLESCCDTQQIQISELDTFAVSCCEDLQSQIDIIDMTNNYVHAFDTTTQTIAITNTFQNITLNTNADIDGWAHTTGSADFTCNQTGRYLITYDAIVNEGSGTPVASFRATLNGTPISGSQAAREVFRNVNPMPISHSFIEQINTNDILRFQFTAQLTPVRVVSATVSGSTFPSFNITISRIE